MEKVIKRDGLFKYTFYDEHRKEIAVIDLDGLMKVINNDTIGDLLNIESLKKILNADEIIVDEIYRK